MKVYSNTDGNVCCVCTSVIGDSQMSQLAKFSVTTMEQKIKGTVDRNTTLTVILPQILLYISALRGHYQDLYLQISIIVKHYEFKEMRGYCKLQKKAIDHTLWRTRFGRGYGHVAS